VFIDARHHVWRLAHGYPWLDAPRPAPIRRDFDLTDLRAAVGPVAVERTVLVEAGREAAGEVTEFLALAEAEDLVAGVVGWADPVAPDLAGAVPVRPGPPGQAGIAAGEHDAWRALRAPLARLPNVTAKLSGLVTEADWGAWRSADLRPFVASALELFGARRLMFGSDWPVCLLAANYPRVVDALTELLDGATPAKKADIWGGTAARTYRLGSRGAPPVG
jgi:L-fuconolactonase